MTPRDRVMAAIHGGGVDRPPFAFWRHFPKDDLDPVILAERHVEWQSKIGNDLLKVTPVAGFMPEMWGVKLEYRNDEEGTRNYLTTVINDPPGWRELKAPEMKSGIPAREVKAAQLTRLGAPQDVPVIQTVFSPLSIAAKLRGPAWKRDLQEHPEELKAGLTTIAATVKLFSLECIKAGLDGIFFATQSCSADDLSEADFRAFGRQFDVDILMSLRQHSKIVLLHGHGANPHFRILSEYPVDMINWHDRQTEPTLKAGQGISPRAVCGGIERKLFLRGTADDVRARVKDAVAQTSGQKFMLGAGCVIPIDTPDELIQAAKDELGVRP